MNYLNYHFWELKKTSNNIEIKKILKNIDNIKKYFKNFLLFFINKKIKNIFLNLSFLFSGKIIYKASSGFFFKRSLKKTYYAAEKLFKKIQLPIQKYKFKKNFIFLNIKGFFFHKGFSTALRYFLSNFNYDIFKINNISFKAHNGVRVNNKRRK